MATIDMDRPKRGGGLLCPLRGELGPRLIQCGLGRGVLTYQVVSSPTQPFGHNRREPKTGGMCDCAPFMGSCDPIYHNVAWAEVYLRTKRHLDPSSRLATGQKFDGVGVPFFLGVAGSPSNTKSPGPRSTSIPSGILVHPAVWPQRTLAKTWGTVPL